MEHRWGERVLLDIPVTLVERPDAVCRLRNLSTSGAFIETAAQVPLFGLLHVVFVRGVGNHEGSQSVPAYVVRVSSAGIAVEWCTFAPDAIRPLLTTAAAGNLTVI